MKKQTNDQAYLQSKMEKYTWKLFEEISTIIQINFEKISSEGFEHHESYRIIFESLSRVSVFSILRYCEKLKNENERIEMMEKIKNKYFERIQKTLSNHSDGLID